MKTGTVALVLRCPAARPQDAVLVEALSDDREIELMEAAIIAGEKEPLDLLGRVREREKKEEEEFGNYVEDLLSKPFLRPEVQEHAVQWLHSKIRIDKYQKSEQEAVRVIADYALKLFQGDPEKVDFLLAGPHAQVRVRIFVIEESRSAAA